MLTQIELINVKVFVNITTTKTSWKSTVSRSTKHQTKRHTCLNNSVNEKKTRSEGFTGLTNTIRFEIKTGINKTIWKGLTIKVKTQATKQDYSTAFFPLLLTYTYDDKYGIAYINFDCCASFSTKWNIRFPFGFPVVLWFGTASFMFSVYMESIVQ